MSLKEHKNVMAAYIKSSYTYMLPQEFDNIKPLALYIAYFLHFKNFRFNYLKYFH